MTSKTLSTAELNEIPHIKKRDLSLAPFDIDRIFHAVLKAMQATGEGSDRQANEVARKIFKDVLKLKKALGSEMFTPTVEMIQDLVEEELMLSDYVKTAKAYILYRNERAEKREKLGIISPRVQKLVDESKSYFRNALGEFMYYRSYSRWIPDEQRRETWVETVDRYMSFMRENLKNSLSETEYADVRDAILKQKVMPSMRLMQFAGPAARRTNACAYNCSFIAPARLEDFAEVMYISMCGTGVGFSVESRNVQKLPQVAFQSGVKEKTHQIADSKEGWCDALTFGIKAWFAGKDVEFDYSLVRPEGERLMVMGGKSSGPDPLRQLMRFTREKIFSRQGRRLRNIDVHDILCKIGEIVVSGGVRRSALISLSDFDDSDMRNAKTGQFWMTEPQRSLSNNSAVYEAKPTATEFLDEWVALMKSGTGERGIFNRGGLWKTLPKRRLIASADYISEMGTNPCGEIILRSKQFCNLSEVIAREDDTVESLREKIRIATILGTYQSTLTKFPYISSTWKKNCEAERLLGVSITGQWDSKVVRDSKVLSMLRDESVKINKKYAKKLGINESTCITCVKPSGTVSQTFDTSSGTHPRYSEYYIRRVRISATDSLFKMLKDQDVPYFPEVGQTKENATTFVFEFPIQSPKNSVYKDDLTAIDQLEYWKMVKENFTEHNPSVTVSVDDNEWIQVAHWIYSNWNIVGGLSFLPRNDHVYQLAPYEEINKQRYEELAKHWKHINFAKILAYEQTDETDVKKELACVSGVCSIDDALAMEAAESTKV